jgi:hypothetical protein
VPELCAPLGETLSEALNFLLESPHKPSTNSSSQGMSLDGNRAGGKERDSARGRRLEPTCMSCRHKLFVQLNQAFQTIVAYKRERERDDLRMHTCSSYGDIVVATLRCLIKSGAGPCLLWQTTLGRRTVQNLGAIPLVLTVRLSRGTRRGRARGYL